MADISDNLTQRQLGYLFRESDAAKYLLTLGLRATRNAAYVDGTRDPILALLSSGVEKVLKLCLGLMAVAETGNWTDKKTYQKTYGHQTVVMDRLLRERVRVRLPFATQRGYVERKLAEVEADALWPVILEALDRYGRGGRFYYLDALANEAQDGDGPDAYWEAVITKARDSDPVIGELFHAYAADIRGKEAFFRAAHEAIASSVQRWWDLLALAGIHDMMGPRGVGWATDQRAIATQLFDEAKG